MAGKKDNLLGRLKAMFRGVEFERGGGVTFRRDSQLPVLDDAIDSAVDNSTGTTRLPSPTASSSSGGSKLLH